MAADLVALWHTDELPLTRGRKRHPLSRNVPGGAYEVIKVLPDPDGEREYRIKSANEP
jgi:hypothetical protein